MRLDRRLLNNSRRSYSLARPRRSRRSFGGFLFWLVIAALGILGALGVVLFHLLAFARSLDRLPPGLVAGGVPVAGLTPPEAEARLREVYLSPLALDYGGAPIQLDPAQVGFHIETQAMLQQLPARLSSGSVWRDFLAYLWNRRPAAPTPIPLQAGYDPARLSDFLDEVAARYDDPGRTPHADPATLGFTPGSAGRALDREAALAQISAALVSPEAAVRRISLQVQEGVQAPITFDTLAELLYDDVRLFQFDGTASLYVADPKTGEDLSMAVRNQRLFDVDQGIAYSGMSTIKIPVAVTYFRYREGDLSPDEELLLGGVFEESANSYTDLILGLIGGGSGLRGADVVSATMNELGLPNIYLSGLLDTLGAVSGPRSTPANSRPDINLDPDPYNQISAADMGRLLVMIYQCAQGGGPLIESFPGQFTAGECEKIIGLLKSNRVGPIFVEGGVPEGTPVAHKHGWDLLPLNNVGDAALVFSPGGDYVMVVYANREEPVPFEFANRMIVSLSRAVYNYYNPP